MEWQTSGKIELCVRRRVTHQHIGQTFAFAARQPGGDKGIGQRQFAIGQIDRLKPPKSKHNRVNTWSLGWNFLASGNILLAAAPYRQTRTRRIQAGQPGKRIAGRIAQKVTIKHPPTANPYPRPRQDLGMCNPNAKALIKCSNDAKVKQPE